MTPLISIVGKSGAGKTTLIEKLVPELKRRGLRVGVIKHHAHPTPIDAEGKDSARFTKAGADPVIVSSPIGLARFERVARELTLAEIAARVDVDLILAEGFKREPGLKIEVSRAELGVDLVARPDELIAIASDHPVAANVPCFDLDDAAALAAFIVHFVSTPAG